jgi:hypothetical protein
MRPAGVDELGGEPYAGGEVVGQSGHEQTGSGVQQHDVSRRAALALEDARHREVLPLFRRGGASEAFKGFEAQLERLEAEPGVRQQL